MSSRPTVITNHHFQPYVIVLHMYTTIIINQSVEGTWPIQKEHLMPAEMRKELCALFKSMIACWEVDEPKPQDIAQLFEKTRDFCKQIPC